MPSGKQRGECNVREIRITMKDGEVWEIDPVIQITIDNSFAEYDINGDDIQSIEVIHATG